MAPKHIYVFIGNDDLTISRWSVKIINEKDTDPSIVDMNVFRSEIGSVSKSELRSNLQAMPFLAQSRYVILEKAFSPGAGGYILTTEAGQKEFLEALESASPETVVTIFDADTDLNDRRIPKPKQNFGNALEKKFGDNVTYKEAMLPTEQFKQMQWIEKEAKNQKVSIDRKGQMALLARVENFDPRVLSAEIKKLSAYVNFEREITEEDVEAVGIRVLTGDIFQMVDAIGAKNKRLALDAYHKIILESSPEEVFQMIIRQFRMILAVKDAIENGLPLEALGQYQDLRNEWIRKKIAGQSRNFHINDLKAIYKRLLRIDEVVKSSAIDLVTATDMLIAEIS